MRIKKIEQEEAAEVVETEGWSPKITDHNIIECVVEYWISEKQKRKPTTNTEEEVCKKITADVFEKQKAKKRNIAVINVKRGKKIIFSCWGFCLIFC